MPFPAYRIGFRSTRLFVYFHPWTIRSCGLYFADIFVDQHPMNNQCKIVLYSLIAEYIPLSFSSYVPPCPYSYTFSLHDVLPILLIPIFNRDVSTNQL